MHHLYHESCGDGANKRSIYFLDLGMDPGAINYNKKENFQVRLYLKPAYKLGHQFKIYFK